MANSNITREIENLAAEIGENIYIDVAKWHLYLTEAHLHTKVAEQVYPLIENNELTEDSVTSILRDIRVPLGGGKMNISLLDLLPNQCQISLVELLEEYQRNQ